MCKCFGRVGENREGMETGDAGREGGDAAICVALVKGETQIAVDIGKRTFISIHAPAKGATRPLTRPSSSARYFNPRSREGSDSTLCGGNLFLICISIHAPAKGATSDASSGSIGRSYFNPRSREGSDQAAAKESRGGGNFNPRSREGSDVGRCNLERLTAISIHAPAKGATSSAGR